MMEVILLQQWLLRRDILQVIPIQIILVGLLAWIAQVYFVRHIIFLGGIQED